MDAQSEVLEELVELAEAAAIPIWLYGGYGLDALEGRGLRSHGDIDFFVRKEDHERLRGALCESGFAVVDVQPHHSKFEKMGQSLDCLTYEKWRDGTLVTNSGDEGVWPWPDNAFPDQPNGELVGHRVRAISYEAFYVFKAGWETYDPGRPLREKDRDDLGVIEHRVPPAARRELESLFEPLPGTRKRYPGDKA